MADHFKFYPDARDTIVPWNARYQFPSQSNKATKVTPRIPPKNGGSFAVGSAPYIRLEFPADGYVNPLNTSIAFNVTLKGWTADTIGNSFVRFQNNIQSIFRRVRILYGSTPLEDIIDYNRIVRMLTEHTASSAQGTFDASSISEGIGGVTASYTIPTNEDPTVQSSVGCLVNVRQNFIQGIDNAISAPAFQSTPGTVIQPGAKGDGAVPNGNPGSGQTTVRRYQVNLAAGLFTQDKLIPTKFMASQLAIEIELAPPNDCMVGEMANATGNVVNPSYTVDNVYLIPEILHFDPAYDQMFLRGLREGGVPIKFASWHTFNFNTGGAQQLNLLIQERSRSVKALFCTQRRPSGWTASPAPDGGGMSLDSGAQMFSSAGVLQQFQWRIGGRYFPAAPVMCSFTSSGGTTSAQGAEAWTEAEKAFNIVGDYRLSQPNNTLRWAMPYNSLQERDFRVVVNSFFADGTPNGFTPVAAGMSGNMGSACFVAAVSLESSNGMEISGLNAEEQSDISFNALYSAAQQNGFIMSVYAHFDAMLVLRENNVMELIQ